MLNLLQNIIGITNPEQIAYLDFDEIQEIPFHLYWKDHKNKYLGANNYLAKDLGFSTGPKILGHTNSDFFPKGVDWIKTNDQTVITRNKKIIYFEEADIGTSNEKITVISHKMPLYTRSKKVIGIMGVSFVSKKDNAVFIDSANTQVTKLSASFYKAPGLTKRQCDCLYYLVRGFTQKEIARKLRISPRTVEYYLEEIKVKLNCNTRSDLIAKALRMNFIRNRIIFELC